MSVGVKRLRVINVLSPEYFKDAHIKGSINVPLDELKDFAQHTDKDIPLVVYCASFMCSASVKAGKILQELGFENVLEYAGGMNEWYHAGLPTVGECKQTYLQEPVERPADAAQRPHVIDIHDLKVRMEKAKLL